jgi:hypothetical protein
VTVTRRPYAPCPYCGKATDADAPAPGTDENVGAPGPGDVSVCFYCAGISIFTETGLRKPTEDERAELLDDPDVIEAAAAVLGYRADMP